MKYRVIIKNSVGIILYDENVTASNETEAVIKILNCSDILCDGDTISVEML